MVLGIKLEIDKASVKNASKDITAAAEKSIAKKEKAKQIATEEQRIMKERGIEDPDGKAGKKDKGAFGGAALGGFIGAIIGSLKPVKELLGVVAGIMQVFLVPILILLKPFLILFLKVGIALLNSLKPGSGGGISPKGVATIGAIIFGVLAAVALAIAGAPALLIAAIAAGVVFLLIAAYNLGVWLGEKFAQFFTWLLNSVILPAWQWIIEKIKQIGDLFVKAWLWVKDVSNKIKNLFVNGFNLIVNFLNGVPGLLKNGVILVVDFFRSIPDLFKDGLKVIANLGTLIWDWIKKSLGFGSSSSETSVNDALITNSGQIIRLNPNDNVLAFQNFSQVDNISNSNGGGKGNIYITVQGFVGDEDTLADRIGKALNKNSRGSIVNFN